MPEKTKIRYEETAQLEAQAGRIRELEGQLAYEKSRADVATKWGLEYATLRIRELEAALAQCECWNREMGGTALADTNTCKDFAKYLADCGLRWCPPCRAAEALKGDC